MKTALTLALIGAALIADAEVYRIRYALTVDIVDDAGKVIGKKRLPAKTLLTAAEPESGSDAGDAADAPAATPSKTFRLKPSISPIMFKNTRPKSAVLLADVSLGSFYTGPFENNKPQFWSINVNGLNLDGTHGEMFWGYIKKNNRRAAGLINAIQDGSSKRAHIKVSPVAGEDDCLMIEDIEIVPKADD